MSQNISSTRTVVIGVVL